jgi:hypothetical protein
VVEQADRLTILVYILVLTRHLQSRIPEVGAPDADPIEAAEHVVLLGNRLYFAIRKASEINAWTGEFALSGSDANAFIKAWDDDELRALRNAYEHAEDRMLNPGHEDVGAPTGTRRVLGVEIPWYSDGSIGGKDGPEAIWLFGLKYDTRAAIAAVARLRTSLTGILVDENDRLRAEPLEH